MATKRSPYDFYPTPKDAFDRFWQADKENWKDNSIVLEPCAGDGNIISYLKEVCPKLRIVANELDKTHENKLNNSGADNIVFFDFLNKKPSYYDVIITNPPFSLAQEFIETSLKQANRVIMLLRLNFLGSQKRKPFWDKYPPSRIYVLSKRPSFTGNGTDSQDYAWFVWDNAKYDQQIVVV